MKIQNLVVNYKSWPVNSNPISLYSIKLYIGTPISISVALSTCVLFISFMELVNGAQFLNITFLLTLFAAAPAAAVLADIYL